MSGRQVGKTPSVANSGVVPPHNLDAEAIVLSTVLFASSTYGSARAADAALVVESLGAEMFYSHANARIFEVAQAIAMSGGTPSAPAVASVLKSRRLIDAVGGEDYIRTLELQIPYVDAVREHCRVIKDLHAVRRLIVTCQIIAAEGYGELGDVRGWLDEAEGRVREVSAGLADDESSEPLRATLPRVFDDLKNGEVRGVGTGLRDLDRLLGPMRGGHLVVVGAHSGIGKSALGAEVAAHLATTRPYESVQVYSLEMTKEEIAARMLFSRARVDSTKGAMATLSPVDWERLTAAARELEVDNLEVDDKPGLNIARLFSRARRASIKQKQAGRPLSLVLVDYVQLITPIAAKGKSREQEVSEVSRGLKELAKALGCTVMALAQLNEDSRKEKRRPRGRDLRESRALLHDADKVVLIYNENAEARADAWSSGDMPETRTSHAGGELVELIVDKNRGGRVGRARALFFPTYTTFEDAANPWAAPDPVVRYEDG